MTDLSDLIESRMRSGEPFTYGMLCDLVRGKDQGRTADKLIQKWRRNGWIAFTREGRNTVWRLTPAYLSLQESSK